MIAAMASDAWAVCREIRRRTGLSQRGLAVRSGVTPATIARIEKGRMEPTLALLERIARGARLEIEVGMRPFDPDEHKARIAARSLTDEERLEQNDALSKLAVAALRTNDA